MCCILQLPKSGIWAMTTLEKKEEQSVYHPPSCIFSNVRAAYPVVIQSTPSWNEKMEGSASKFKGSSREEENTDQAEHHVKHCKSFAFSYILGEYVVTEVLAPRCLGGGPTAICCTPVLTTHTPWAETELWAPISPSQWSVGSMTGQLNSLKLQKTNIVKHSPQRTNQPTNQPKIYFIFSRSVDWPSLPCEQIGIRVTQRRKRSSSWEQRQGDERTE